MPTDGSLIYKGKGILARHRVSGKNAHLTCPFCLNQCIHAEPGTTPCPICDAIFEIDDRIECVFADTDSIRLPVNEIICGFCGPVQGGNRKNCLYCGIGINTAVH